MMKKHIPKLSTSKDGIRTSDSNFVRRTPEQRAIALRKLEERSIRLGNSKKWQDEHCPKPSRSFLQKQKDHRLKRDQFDVAKLFGISGVYFLFKEKELVYIGESCCVITRISDHFKSGKDFDSFGYDVISESKRKKVERKLIKKHKPLWNVVHNRNMRPL